MTQFIFVFFDYTVCRLKYYCSASSAFRNSFASLSSIKTQQKEILSTMGLFLSFQIFFSDVGIACIYRIFCWWFSLVLLVIIFFAFIFAANGFNLNNLPLPRFTSTSNRWTEWKVSQVEHANRLNRVIALSRDFKTQKLWSNDASAIRESTRESLILANANKQRIPESCLK